MNKPFTLGITGGSGSGKTYFIENLSARFKPEEMCLLSQDHYYKPLDQQFTDEQGFRNFDLPGAIDRESFQADLLALKAGRNILKKEYTFNHPLAEPKILEFKPAPILVVEGLFIQYFEEIEKELDLKLFIEAQDHIMLERRIKRDQLERNSPPEDVLYRYQHHVMPVYNSLIRPLRHKADLVVPNSRQSGRALDVLVSFLRARIDGVAY